MSAAKAAAQGYQGYLRIAICDSLAQPHIATLLARSREEEPELEIRVFELPFAQQLKTLQSDPSFTYVGSKVSGIPDFLAMNTKKAPFDNVKVRQAVAYAVPYDKIMS